MRELIFKNLTTAASKKRDISVEEIFEQNGIISTSTKRSIYFVRDVHHIKSQNELQEWINERKKNPALNKKFFHVMHNYSDREKFDKLICKMRGSFYVISGHCVYNIVFIHVIKIKMHKAEREQCI